MIITWYTITYIVSIYTKSSTNTEKTVNNNSFVCILYRTVMWRKVWGKIRVMLMSHNVHVSEDLLPRLPRVLRGNISILWVHSGWDRFHHPRCNFHQYLPGRVQVISLLTYFSFKLLVILELSPMLQTSSKWNQWINKGILEMYILKFWSKRHRVWFSKYGGGTV